MVAAGGNAAAPGPGIDGAGAANTVLAADAGGGCGPGIVAATDDGGPGGALGGAARVCMTPRLPGGGALGGAARVCMTPRLPGGGALGGAAGGGAAGGGIPTPGAGCRPLAARSFITSVACQPMTVLALAGAGACGCLVPQKTQCIAASGRSLAQLVHFFTVGTPEAPTSAPAFGPALPPGARALSIAPVGRASATAVGA
jgi:hypothetical protein